ncbi:hypothetical protein [Brevundimonas nasdae]|uniref:hypothetical protein n=1 Tax=Brevundimonas nasdae TaxID=172043 RepID=UPI003F690116
MLIAGLLAVVALTDPDGVVATAPSNALDVAAAMAAPSAVAVAVPTAQDAAPHGLTTEQQIQNWIASRTPGASFDEPVDSGPAPERKMHGMVEAGIGTGGYRNYGAAVSLPLGENGRLDLAYREGKNDYWGMPGLYGSPGLYGAPGWYGRPGYYPGYGMGRYRVEDSTSRTVSVGLSWSKDGDKDERRDRPFFPPY